MMVNVTTKPCIMCGNTSELRLERDRVKRWLAGEHVQNVFPDMSADRRELLITGTHPACWDAMFADEDE